MNKKDFKKIKARELEGLLDALGASRMDIADALEVGESTLRRWVRNRLVPVSEWEKLNSEDFKKTLAIRKKFGSNHYVVPEHETKSGKIDYAIAPPTESADYKEEYGIDGIPTESLVGELENRGWTVTLQKKQ